MPERIRIETDLQRLPQDAWRSLQCEHPALRLEVLQSYASTAPAGIALCVFLLEDEIGIAAAGVCRQLPPGYPGSVAHMLFGRATDGLHRVGLFRRPVLECCAPSSTAACGVLLRAADASAQRAALRQLFDAMEDHARGRSMDLAFVAVPADDSALHSELHARRHLQTPMPPVAHLHVQWADFDGYVAWLGQRSRKAARNARFESRRNLSCGVTIRRTAPSNQTIAELHALLCSHHQHKNGWEAPISAAFLQQLALRLGEDFLLFEAERQGKRIAMLGGVRAGASAWMAWFGIELQDRQNDFTYPCLSYYHPATVAAQLGLHHLIYGTAALEAKRARGCEVVASELHYRPSGGVMGLFGGSLLRLQRAWKERPRRSVMPSRAGQSP